jgi:hypothetical protein
VKLVREHGELVPLGANLAVTRLLRKHLQRRYPRCYPGRIRVMARNTEKEMGEAMVRLVEAGTELVEVITELFHLGTQLVKEEIAKKKGRVQ